MVTTKQKPCEHCGTLFPFKRSTAKFCSDSCSKAARRKSTTGKQPRKQLKGSIVTCSGAFSSPCDEAKTAYRKADDTRAYKCRPCRSKEAEHNALHRFYKSRFFEQLLRDCKRAGTLEVFDTLEDVTF